MNKCWNGDKCEWNKVAIFNQLVASDCNDNVKVEEKYNLYSFKYIVSLDFYEGGRLVFSKPKRAKLCENHLNDLIELTRKREFNNSFIIEGFIESYELTEIEKDEDGKAI